MRRRALVIVLCALIFAAGFAPVGAQSGSISDAESKANAAAERVADARVRADDASAAFLAAESDLEVLNEQVVSLQATVETKRVELEGLKEELRQFAIYRYTGGSISDSTSLIGVRDINQVVAKDALADLVGDRQVDVIDLVKNAQQQYENEASALAVRQGEQQTLTEVLAGRQQVVSQELAAMQSELDGLNAILTGLRDAEAKRIRDAALAKARERARIAEEARTKADAEARKNAPATTAVPASPAPAGAGSLVCPVPGSSFSNSWGQPRSGGRGHKGVDMIAPTGTPTYAPVSGDLTFSSDSLGGRTWNIWGDDGNFYYGAHLSSIGPRSGRVTAGEFIGNVGSTGNASIAHLHFEVHVGRRGNQTNPYPLVAAVC